MPICAKLFYQVEGIGYGLDKIAAENAVGRRWGPMKGRRTNPRGRTDEALKVTLRARHQAATLGNRLTDPTMNSVMSD